MFGRDPVQVFAYGTLTDPDQLAAVLGDREWTSRGPAILEGLHRIEGRYPTLTPGGTVEGQLYAVDQRGMTALDRYEGVPTGLYVRLSVPVANTDETAAVYVGDPDRLAVSEPCAWPTGPPFPTQVRRYCHRNDVMVRPID